MKSSLSRALFVSGATVGALLIGAGAASAHVVVSAPDAAQGGYSVLTFRVPTESDTASTSSVKVTLPGLNSARTQPVPGWTSTVEKDSADLAVSVTWTANPGSEVGPGQFQQFLLSAGPLPEQETVSFPATQTYTDGEVVDWNEPMTEDGSEPELPAPTLTLAAAGSGDAHGSAHSETTAASEASSEDNTARWLAGVGLVLGAVGAGLGIGATIRARRS
ncbi:YcnI family protein [Rhodococcus sp. IEGM 1401]|uniref:YcnI family copper-binding membrane protein n=1 Tax=unclassified Rhodococcus (in: high G+C Gram-positive bacteria) TaxID=192944 RepID=UPI0022B3CC49|nr:MULTISPECIES: YcnI family protein [unclassified Rhodococcus (in: high G+C Gram-positive bacteria)]MCZ4563416.1 YcnI family protein [Rhodococcus sp. IEGM 1401]MDI9923539.1 YcnI family protein [Rhodococcus sp. IEGM 1372]MDV8036029.1 YcnI family protein [Rhodococcus sp. IEGM 1414]